MINKRGKVSICLVEVALLISMSFAISFIIGENLTLVNALTINERLFTLPSTADFSGNIGTLADGTKVRKETSPQGMVSYVVIEVGSSNNQKQSPQQTQKTGFYYDEKANQYVYVPSDEEKKAAPITGSPTEAYRPISSTTIEQAIKSKNVEEKLNVAKEQNIKIAENYRNDPNEANKRALDLSAKNVEKLQKEYDTLKSTTTSTEAGAGKATMKIGPFDVPESPGAHLLAGAVWAGAAYGALEFVVNMIGLKDEQKKSVQYGVSSGVMAYQMIKAYQSTDAAKAGSNFLGFGKEGIFGKSPGFVGAAIAVAVFLATYKKEKTELVTFTALPWQPPTGGRYCEECNKDPFRPCSEYRCKSLGQACELLNKGSEQEKCVWVNPGDVNSPIITPWKNALSPDELQFTSHQTRPPSRGTKIIHTKTMDKCLPAFTKLQFGITTNEPAQCKIDIQIKSFEELQYYVGGTNFFKLNHTQVFRLPAPEANTTDYAPVLQPDGTFTYFIKCMDANGNKNDDDFAISFCVDESPDTTPPLIENSSILSGSPVTSGIDNLTIEIYVNEPSECKWSIADKGYSDMEHGMTCATQSNQINAELTYTCTGLLTGIINQQQNKFYFRCKDKPQSHENERNVMAQSFELVLLGTQTLNIIETSPNETIKGPTSSVKLELSVETDDGAEEGKALCMFSGTDIQGSYIPMFETNSHLHKQTLELGAGAYKYYFLCIDGGGNSANASTTFSVETDKEAPIVVRTYKEQPDALKVVTNEDAKCTYSLNSCNFVLTDGQAMLNSPPSDKTNHYAKWESGKVYFIKCKDEFGNEPSPNQCSMIAGATEV